MKRFIVVFYIINFGWIKYSDAQNYSIKNRWNINVSYSLFPLYGYTDSLL
jgi:hypothetical protein